MPEVKYKVELSEAETIQLKEITHKGKTSARTIMHAQILLNTDEKISEKKKKVREVAEKFGVSPNTVNEIRKTYTLEGFEAAQKNKNDTAGRHK